MTDLRTELQLSRFLPYVLTSLAERVSTSLAGIYADEFDLTIAEWRVLAHLAEHATLTAAAIATFTGMEKSKVSRAVGRLETRGVLTWCTAAKDSRAKDLSLTDSGRELYRQVVPRVLAWEQQLLEGLSAAEYRDLLHGMDRLRERLAAIS